jgi:hypothetical protein
LAELSGAAVDWKEEDLALTVLHVELASLIKASKTSNVDTKKDADFSEGFILSFPFLPVL